MKKMDRSGSGGKGFVLRLHPSSPSFFSSSFPRGYNREGGGGGQSARGENGLLIRESRRVTSGEKSADPRFFPPSVNLFS